MCKKIILFLSIVILSERCTKAPVVSDLSRYATNSYPTQLSDLLSVLGSTYGNIRSQQLYGFQTLCKTFAATEHTSNLCFGGADFWTDIEYNNLKTSNSLAQDSWTGYYTGVKDANVTLEAADFYEKNYMVPGELQQVNYYTGRSLFFKSMVLFSAGMFFW